MNRIKTTFKIIHISVLSLIFASICWIFWNEGHSDWFLLSAVFVSSSSIIFYCHFFILGRYLNRKKYLWYILGLILIIFAGPFLYMWLDRSEIVDWRSFREQYFTTLASFVLFFVVLSWIAKATENWFVNMLKRETLEKQALSSELAYLKSQINPHFLFNTLNNIHTLAYVNSPSTADAIMRLSSLMRYMLYDSNADTVPLQKEIDYLKDFISLQQLRFQDKEIVTLEIAGDTGRCRVAPLLLVHLLENAYKHSPAKLAMSDIKIRIEVQENTLTFSMQNPIKNIEKPLDEPGGFGLSNVKKRLQLLYPHQYTFDTRSSGNLFKVVLVIPLQQTGQ